MTTLRRSVLAALLFTGSAVLGSGTTGCSDTNAQGLITDAAGAAGGNLDGGGTG